MTTETTTTLAPEQVLRAVRNFFMGSDSVHSAWLETESETHISFGTFRGNLAIAAFPDPLDEAPTRVRISTLREEGMVGRLVTYLRTRETVGQVAHENESGGAAVRPGT
jgi:hypothetical protein